MSTPLTTDPDHGKFIPGKGYYDQSIGGYVDSAHKVTPVRWGEDRQPSDALKKAAEAKRQEFERQQTVGRQRQGKEFVADPAIEEFRRLRFRDPDKFDKIAAGRHRMSVARYESDLKAHLAAGGSLPEGVLDPRAD